MAENLSKIEFVAFCKIEEEGANSIKLEESVWVGGLLRENSVSDNFFRIEKRSLFGEFFPINGSALHKREINEVVD